MAQHDKMLFNGWTNVVSSVRNELVFEGRNREYGAYQIRRNYNRTVSFALLITFSALVIGIVTPKIIAWITNTMDTKEVIVNLNDEPIDMTPPPLDEIPPPPPPPPPPPVATTVAFLEPVPDDEVEEDEATPPIEEEKPVQISTVTNVGDGEVVIPDDPGDGVVETVDEVFTIVEEMPGFPGGEAERIKFFQRNCVYPELEKEAGIQGTVYVSFVVEKDGSITDVKLLRGVSGGANYDREALRVTKMMPPWKIGKQNGRAVRVQYNMPVKFILK